jgi:hypothetical protein
VRRAALLSVVTTGFFFAGGASSALTIRNFKLQPERRGDRERGKQQKIPVKLKENCTIRHDFPSPME